MLYTMVTTKVFFFSCAELQKHKGGCTPKGYHARGRRKRPPAPCQLQSAHLTCSSAEGDFTPSGGRGKGYVQFIPMLTALDPKAGYLGEGHLTIGVHICLSVTNMVMAAAWCRNGAGMSSCSDH